MNPMTESSVVAEPLVDSRTSHIVGGSHGPHGHEPPPPRPSILRRLIKTLFLTILLTGGAVFGMYKMRVNIPALNTTKLYAHIDDLGARAEELKGRIAGQYEAHFGKHEEEVPHEEHKIVVTSPIAKEITITQEYVCQIHSQRHTEILSFDDGYLEAIRVKEGQTVKEGDVLFQIKPVIFKAELAAEEAERDLAALELKYTQTLADKQGVSPKEVSLFKAKLARAQAKVDLAQAKLNFATVVAPFDGIIDRLERQQGTLVKEGDRLTTLSDNSVMWVYFNVPEKRYLEFMAETEQNKQSPDIELRLADHNRFPERGKIGAIEANFNNENGNIAFRADFPNPKRLLRHGQTGTVLIKRELHDAIVIPQRATFENLAKRYVYVIDKEEKVRQREIEIKYELEDIYVVGKELDVNDKIILEGIRQVREGEKVEFEFRPPAEVIANQKNRAE
jgi:membrane fusion protein (multidrug efflux system)